MPPPDYVGFLHSTMNSEESQQKLSDVAYNISEIDRLMVLTNGEFEQMNPTIDAQLDVLVASCHGEERLALFAAVAGMHTALKQSINKVLDQQAEIDRLKRSHKRKRR